MTPSLAYRSLDFQNTGVAIKSAPGEWRGCRVFNNHATTIRYLKFYNLAAAPTASDTPFLTIAIKAQGDVTIVLPNGIHCDAGIGVRCTTELADNGNTGPTAGDVTGLVFYR